MVHCFHVCYFHGDVHELSPNFFRSKTTSENASKTCVMDLQDSHGIPMDVHPGMKLQLQCFSPEHVVSPVMEIPEEFLGAVTQWRNFVWLFLGMIIFHEEGISWWERTDRHNPWRIHGAGIYANINGYIDGIHGTPYIAAPLGSYG